MTDDQYNKLVRYIKKKFAYYDQAIEDLWKAVNDDTMVQRVDELDELLHRTRRAVSRLEREIE